jgi:hypothetical protein
VDEISIAEPERGGESNGSEEGKARAGQEGHGEEDAEDQQAR